METKNEQEALKRPTQPLPYIVTTKDLVMLTFAIAGILVGMGVWYNSTYVDSKFNDLSKQLEKLGDKMDSFSIVFTSDIREIDKHATAIETTLTSTKEQLNKSEAKFDKLAEDLRDEFGNLDIKFANLENSLDNSIKVVEEKTESTEKKFEEKLAAMPEAEEVVDQLDQHKEDIEKQQNDIASINREFNNTDRDIILLKTLIKLGVERPIRQEILQQLALDNPNFKENPEALIALWKSQPRNSPAKFATKLIDGYGVLENKAMLLAYDELTEPKPIRFFVKPDEIKASAEPALAAAQATGSESTVPLAEPLTIARVCSEMSKPEIECYNFFLNITSEVADDVISLNAPSDTAVIKIIVDKYETEIPQ